MVPNQPPPAYGDVSQEAAAGLEQLGRLGIRIGTLVVHFEELHDEVGQSFALRGVADPRGVAASSWSCASPPTRT